MRVTELMGLKLVHNATSDITGEILDIVFRASLEEAEFFLVDVKTSAGTAPILIGPTVLTMVNGQLTLSAHEDDVRSRVAASIERADVPVDPSHLPNTVIGPFGNTFSPTMMAALFNRRRGIDRTALAVEESGVWFSELQDHAVCAHLANIARVKDVVLDDGLLRCDQIELATTDGSPKITTPAEIHVTRAPDDALVLSIGLPENST